MSRRIDTVIFDLGGVLIDWNPEYVYKNVFRTQEAMDYFLTNICTFPWNEEQDAGRTIEEANKILVAQYPHYEKEILTYYEEWHNMLGGPISNTVEILRELKSLNSISLYALTNWSAETFPVALERYDFLQWFEGILVSGEEGMKKPDIRIYELICKRYNIDKSNAIFIDDNKKNIDAALDFGLQAVHFNGAESLMEILVNQEIIPK